MNRLTASQTKFILEMDEKFRALERAYEADPSDAETRFNYRNELRRLLDMQQIDAVRCLGVYKYYDHGPDSPNMFFVGSQELADMAIAMLDENDAGIVFIEGGEWSAQWASKKAIAELDDVLLTSEEVHKAITEIQGE